MARCTGYAMCDWIDNAIALQMGRTEGQIYGYMHLPCRVEVNARLAPEVEQTPLAEFTGERVIPGQVDVDLLNEHLARYAFAARLARGKRVLDAGCGAGYGSAELARAALVRDRRRCRRRSRGFCPRPLPACPTSPSSRLLHRPAASRCVLRPGGGLRSDRASGATGASSCWKRAACSRPAASSSSPRPTSSTTPNRAARTGANPFHVHEFEFEEFRGALRSRLPARLAVPGKPRRGRRLPAAPRPATRWKCGWMPANRAPTSRTSSWPSAPTARRSATRPSSTCPAPPTCCASANATSRCSKAELAPEKRVAGKSPARISRNELDRVWQQATGGPRAEPGTANAARASMNCNSELAASRSAAARTSPNSKRNSPMRRRTPRRRSAELERGTRPEDRVGRAVDAALAKEIAEKNVRRRAARSREAELDERTAWAQRSRAKWRNAAVARSWRCTRRRAGSSWARRSASVLNPAPVDMLLLKRLLRASAAAGALAVAGGREPARSLARRSRLVPGARVRGTPRDPAQRAPAGPCGASVVIPNWNGRDLLARYLPSVVAALAGNPDNEIIVVDNGSTDGSAAFVASTFPQVKLVALDRNLGFGGGSNAGFRAAKNDIVVLLNSDMRVEPDFLAPAARRLHRSDGVRRLLPDLLQRPRQAPRRDRPHARLVAGWRAARAPSRRPGGRPGCFPCFYGGGGSCAFDRRKFLELGGFDELLAPFYLEDTDLGYLAWKRGWKVLYQPRSVVHHEHRGTIGKTFSEDYIQGVLKKNCLLFAWKNIHEWRRLAGHFCVHLGRRGAERDLRRGRRAGPLSPRWGAPFCGCPRPCARAGGPARSAAVSDTEAFRRPLGGYFRDRFARAASRARAAARALRFALSHLPAGARRRRLHVSDVARTGGAGRSACRRSARLCLAGGRPTGAPPVLRLGRMAGAPQRPSQAAVARWSRTPCANFQPKSWSG